MPAARLTVAAAAAAAATATAPARAPAASATAAPLLLPHGDHRLLLRQGCRWCWCCCCRDGEEGRRTRWCRFFGVQPAAFARRQIIRCSLPSPQRRAAPLAPLLSPCPKPTGPLLFSRPPAAASLHSLGCCCRSATRGCSCTNRSTTGPRRPSKGRPLPHLVADHRRRTSSF